MEGKIGRRERAGIRTAAGADEGGGFLRKLRRAVLCKSGVDLEFSLLRVGILRTIGGFM